MHDSNGKALFVGDQVFTGYRYGLVTVRSIEGDYMVASKPDEAGCGFGHDQKTFSESFPESYKVRTWKEMGAEAIAIQDACNLSGIAISFAQVVLEVLRRLEAEGQGGRGNVAQHPVITMWMSKIVSLTRYDDGLMFSRAYDWCGRGGEEWEVWDRQYHGGDTQDVIFAGSKQQCQDFLTRNKNDRLYLKEGGK